MRLLSFALLVLLVACGSKGSSGTSGSGSSTTPTIEPPPTLSSPTELSKSPALMPLAWLRGDWEAWHWVAAGGALYGVMLPTEGNSFNILIIDDAAGRGPADGKLRSFSSIDGELMQEGEVIAGDRTFTIVERRPTGPVEQTWSWDGDKLHVKVQVADAIVENDYKRTSPRPAPDIEAADRAFADDVAKRGIDAWDAAYAPDGTMIERTAVVKRDAIREQMAPLLAVAIPAWKPLESHVTGNRGFTVGTTTFTFKDPKKSRRTSYVSIWVKQPDGSWKIRTDAGRPVND